MVVYVNHTALRLLLFEHVGFGSLSAGFAALVSSVVVDPKDTGFAFPHPPLPPGVAVAVFAGVAVYTTVAVRVAVGVRVAGMVAGVNVAVLAGVFVADRVGIAVLVGVAVNAPPGVHVGNAVCVGDWACTGARLSSNTAAGTVHSQDHRMPLAAVLLRPFLALHI
jgi:hypothetical protein